jgi:hypothetical protein
VDTDSPRELVAEMEGHLRALLRDVLCGYLEADLKAVADEILIESNGDPLGEIEAHDLRADSDEFEAHDLRADSDEFEAHDPRPDSGEIHATDARARPGEIDVDDVRPEPAEPNELLRESRFAREPEPMTFEPELEWDAEPEYEPGDLQYEEEVDYEAEYDEEPDTAEMEPVAVAPEPAQQEIDGVTQSADWGWDEPEDYSAPV